MLGEFGQVPLCLILDLDSYEESWTHVARFRGCSGWLQVARATIQSEDDLMCARIVTACDEHDNPYPGWQAEHLLECDWSNLRPCFDEVPTVLDDLLCEEEGALYARWQRETNADIAALDDAGQRQATGLEVQAKQAVRRFDRHIADLRRRRRMPEVSIEQRETLDAAIADLEGYSDLTLARMADERAALRREIDAREEALWRRSDVLIETEVLYCIAWSARTSAQCLQSERVAAYPRSADTMRVIHRAQLPAYLAGLTDYADAARRHQWGNKKDLEAIERKIRRMSNYLIELRKDVI